MIALNAANTLGKQGAAFSEAASVASRISASPMIIGEERIDATSNAMKPIKRLPGCAMYSSRWSLVAK